MTLHVVLGDGYMPTKELTAHLNDIKAKALADDDGFWFMVAAKPEPTDTDRALMKWLGDEDVWFDIIGDKESADKMYAGAQAFHKATKLAPTVVKLMKAAKAGGVDEEGNAVEPEDADLLALYFSDEDGAAEDDWLNAAISAVADAGFQVFAFNDGMTPIEPPEGEDEVETGEPEESPAWVGLTREQLGLMDLDELKQIALDKGVTVAPRSRKVTYIDAILDEDEEVPEAEIEAPAPTSIITKTYADDANTATTYTTGTTTGNLRIMGTEISGPAMIVVIYNGQVTSRVVTAEQARELLSY